jgi:formylglycine-generating enzyme required for sulfatase activity
MMGSGDGAENERPVHRVWVVLRHLIAPWISRCAARSSIPPEFQYPDYGFRVACAPDS